MTAALDTMSAEVAVDLRDQIRSTFREAMTAYQDGCHLLITAYHGRAWEALGLPDWQAFLADTLDPEHMRIPAGEERQAIVSALQDAGLTLRDIAAATGLGLATVHRATQPTVSVPNGTPAPAVLATTPDFERLSGYLNVDSVYQSLGIDSAERDRRGTVPYITATEAAEVLAGPPIDEVRTFCREGVIPLLPTGSPNSFRIDLDKFVTLWNLFRGTINFHNGA